MRARHTSRDRESRDEAETAWENGEYERCLQLTSPSYAADEGRRAERAIVRARALVRLGKHAEASQCLQFLLGHSDRDIRLTARSLIGAARIRGGDGDALRDLQQALSDAATAAPAVRAELAVHVALAHYARGAYAAADAALDRVGPETDIVYARALEFRGWIAMAYGDQDRATTSFLKALEVIGGCRRRDRYVEVNCTQALAGLALERFDREAWAVVTQRRAALDWSAGSFGEHRFFIAMRAAVFAYDVEGDPQLAAWEAHCAEEWAPNDAFRTQALCCRAAVARKAREAVSQRNHVEAAYRVFLGMRQPLGEGDETMVPMVLAEELANVGRAAEARSMMAIFRNRRTSAVISMSHDPRLAGYETLVEAQVLEAEGRRREAVAAFREAFEFFSRIGSARRSLTAAVRLLRLAPDDPSLWRHVDAVAAQTAKGSWIASLSEGLRRAHAARTLTAVQRDYLTLLCDGKSNPEIARIRRRSVHTVRNQVAALFETFAVGSRAELVAQCARLGILDSADG